MSNGKLHDWIQITGVFAVVASLVFVGLEVRQSSEAANDEAIIGDLQTIIGVEELVTANPDIWLRGCQGETLSPSDQMVYTHIHHSYEFLNFMRWLRGVKGVDSGSIELAIDNFAMNLYRNPGIRQEWDRHANMRRHIADEVDLHQWRKLVEARVAEYPSFEPEPIDDPYRCGLN